MVRARCFGALFVMTVAAAACASYRPVAEPLARGDAAYQRLIENIVRRHYPAVWASTAPQETRYLYLVGDGRGHVSRRVLETRPPRVSGVPEALVERFPDLPLLRWLESTTDAAFPVAGMSRHDPGAPNRIGRDTLWVFWADAPVPFATVRSSRGFRPGLLVSEQVTPDTVARFAAQVPPGTAVWYVADDARRVLAIGTWGGDNPDIPARQAELAPQFPGGQLTCSLASSIRVASGRLVRIVPIRYQPRPAADAGRDSAISAAPPSASRRLPVF